MKLDAKSVGVESRGVKNTMKFGIGDASVVIDILRNRLYAHPIQALVQEYLSNARDAHREINSSRSIVITIPTELSPVFKVRDFGPGVSPDRYENVFILYGSSTKRDNNIQTGGFGIGAKSAWSYTDSFNVTTFVDGTKRDYINHVGNTNEGEADLISESETDELNGTEIQISVDYNDIYKFRDAIFRATYFWQDQCQFFGIDKDSLPEKIGVIVGEDVEIVPKNHINKLLGINSYSKYLIVSLDGIPYAVKDASETINNVMNMLDPEYTAVVHLGVGDIGVAASRDSINYDDETNDTLELAMHHTLSVFNRYIDNKVSSIGSISGFFDAYKTLEPMFADNYLCKSSLQFNNYKIISWNIHSVDFNYINIEEVQFLYNRRSRSRNMYRLTRNDRKSVNFKDLNHCIYYIDTDESKQKINRRIRTALNIINDDLSNKKEYITVLGSKLNNKSKLMQIVKDLKAIPISSIEMAPVQKRTNTKKLSCESVIVHCVSKNNYHTAKKSHSKYTKYVNLYENEVTYIYVELHKGKFPESIHEGELSDWFEKHYDDQKLVFCGVANRTAKSVKNDSNFISLEKWASKFKPSKDMINDTVYVDSIRRESQIGDLIKILKDLKLRNAKLVKTVYNMNEIINSFNQNQLPTKIKELINYDHEKHSKKINSMIDALRDVKQQYPILQFLLDNTHYKMGNRFKEMPFEDLSLYINYKKRFLKK